VARLSPAIVFANVLAAVGGVVQRIGVKNIIQRADDATSNEMWKDFGTTSYIISN
jgi:hypothetical protein